MSETLRKELRDLKIETRYLIHPEGSCLVSMGNTKVICTASVEERVPPFLVDSGNGWVTAEYSMLPRSTGTRMRRDRSSSSPSSRSLEISRLIGRSLRCGIDMTLLGSRTITLDCDVIQADGGTRCASICGASVALSLAVKKLLENGVISENPVKHLVAAVSVGVIDGVQCLDLDYQLDSRAEVDMNVVMDDSGGFIEIQGTGEKSTFSDDDLAGLLRLAKDGIKNILALQKEVLA